MKVVDITMESNEQKNSGYQSVLCAVEPPSDPELILAMAQALVAEGGELHIVSVMAGTALEDEKESAGWGGEEGRKSGIQMAGEHAVAIDRAAAQALERSLNEQARFIMGSGVAQVHVVTGLARHAILDLARQVSADLILVGTRKTGTATLLFGSTANHVIHGAVCDVLAVRLDNDRNGATSPDRSGPDRYKKVAVGLDFRHTNASKIIAHAGHLAPLDKLSLFHVIQLNDCIGSEGVDTGCVESEYFLAESRLREHGSQHAIPEARQALFVGSLENAIVRIIQDQAPDLFVFGSQGQGDAATLPLDAFAMVLRESNCDILVIH